MEPQDRKVVIVTGASQGIGAGIAARYREKNWAVVATARTIKATKDPAVLAGGRGNISWTPATADRIVGGALETFGRIDTLVNDAGVYLSKPFVSYTAEDYATAVGVNLTGCFRLTQLAITHMLARGAGHVVNITTTLVDVADSTAPTAFTALTKGGIAAMTRSLAVEHASRGIRVNAVSPGIIQMPAHPPESYAGLGERLVPLGHRLSARSMTSSMPSSSWSRRPTSPARSCTSTAARSPVTEVPAACQERTAGASMSSYRRAAVRSPSRPRSNTPMPACDGSSGAPQRTQLNSRAHRVPSSVTEQCSM